MAIQLEHSIATVSFDDGKANAINAAFIDQLYRDLDAAERDAKVVILSGRQGMFSAGFDLKVLQHGGEDATVLVERGMQMLIRLYEFPLPVVAVCQGHAVGLGAFMLLAADSRVGAAGDYQITLPETALGMPFTTVLLTLIHDRLSSAFKTAAAIQASPFAPQDALAAGFLDVLVDHHDTMSHALTLAETLAQLPSAAYCANKRDLRGPSLAAMRRSLVD